MTLADIAPRLARARDAWLAEEALREVRLRVEQGNVHRLERLVAHRELQLARSAGHRDGAYLAERHRKLADAQTALGRAQRRLHHLQHDRGHGPQEAGA